MAKLTTSERMARVPRSNTAPELTVRRLLTRLGLRYRVCVSSLPGCPDIANKTKRWVVFVHGCFWHGHQGWVRGRVPKTNNAFWVAKLNRNRLRDARKEKALLDLGFLVVTVWQCELNNIEALATRFRTIEDLTE